MMIHDVDNNDVGDDDDKPLMRTPCLAATAIAHTAGMGAAMTMAHGQVNTSKISPLCKYEDQSPLTPPPMQTWRNNHHIIIATIITSSNQLIAHTKFNQ